LNSEKILVEIICAGINRSFDCIVPRKITVRSLCQNYLNIIEQHLGIHFGSYPDILVMSADKQSVLSPDATLDEAHIDSGDTLYIV